MSSSPAVVMSTFPSAEPMMVTSLCRWPRAAGAWTPDGWAVNWDSARGCSVPCSPGGLALSCSSVSGISNAHTVETPSAVYLRKAGTHQANLFVQANRHNTKHHSKHAHASSKKGDTIQSCAYNENAKHTSDASQAWSAHQQCRRRWPEAARLHAWLTGPLTNEEWVSSCHGGSASRPPWPTVTILCGPTNSPYTCTLLSTTQ
eukprot:TRINITY_DN10241_c0_g1_i3.p1 TRINITY_DN10241_c0_g1~~TRINITY_DN10241_c0_g1_i3.p1  ORF type:complete len:229 (+),score=11.19 TRINITY_DN10241_c0_g1_i3:81-689(+)